MGGRETIRGELLDFRVRGRNFWGTGVIRTLASGGDVAIVGSVLGAQTGDAVEAVGQYESSKYGRQFRLRSLTVITPADAAGVVAWMSARLPDVGRRRAEEMVERFGVDGLWKVIESEPDRLLEVSGITPARRDAIAATYAANIGERDRMVTLKGWGLTDSQIANLATAWGADVERNLRANPYSAIHEVAGFGWERADVVARRMGVDFEDPSRIDAGVHHVAKLAAGGPGHCYVPHGAIVRIAAQKILRLPEQTVAAHMAKGRGVRGLVTRKGRHYLEHIAEAEQAAAESLAAMASGAA